MKTLFSALLALSLFAAPCAYGVFSISGVGAINLAKPTDAQADAPKMAFGFGALVSFPLVPVLNLEVGAFNLPFKRSVGAVTETYNSFHFPALVRLNLLPIVSLGAGAYVSLLNGNIGNDPGTEVPYLVQGMSTFDFGLALSLSADIPLAPAFAIVADLRYLVGFANLALTPGASTKFGGFLGLVGLKFHI